jgi:GST-like protein
MIDLYTSPTPNGHKISCALEALEIPYKTHAINLMEGEQLTKKFLQISPNGRIPAIVDSENNLSIFESGAILIYLADKKGQLIPTSTKERSNVIQWLMFQMSGIGPMMGQANVFFRYMPEKIPTAIDRYQNECRRLFKVLDKQLSKQDWIAGDYSIADIANWCWVRTYKWSGVNVEGLDNLMSWSKRMYEQPGMLKGIEVPFKVENLLKKENAEKFIKESNKIIQK